MSGFSQAVCALLLVGKCVHIVLKTLKHTKTMTKIDDKDFILQLFLQHKDFTKHNYLSVVLFLVSFTCLLVKPPNNLQFLHLWYYGCIIRTQFFDNRNCIICC